MTEASENDFLVRVRAQVMCRDEGTGGWVAVGAGGLSTVMVGRRERERPGGGGSESNGDTSSNAPAHEYFIHGRRISDDSVVLECTIKKDFQYNKVMPTFHHWVTDEKRFGLTFQTAADARAFDKGVRTAIEELLDGLGGAWPSLHAYTTLNPAPKHDDEEHNIFECLNLPCDSGSETSSASRARRSDAPILSAISLPHHDPLKAFDIQYEDKLDEKDHPQYVHLSSVHEYTYPQVSSISSDKSSPLTKPPLLKHDSGSIKKCSYSTSPQLPKKKNADLYQHKMMCRYCEEWYTESANRAGACSVAPDAMRRAVDAVSCISCAQGMQYHCMADSDGDYAPHPCVCEAPSAACAKRWFGLTLLSIVVPCLCCYLPLRCIHCVARAAKIVGSHHSPIIRR